MICHIIYVLHLVCLTVCSFLFDATYESLGQLHRQDKYSNHWDTPSSFILLALIRTLITCLGWPCDHVTL